MVSFNKLWENHPGNNSNQNPCKNKSGKPAFHNQCAIRMGVCLERSGVNLDNYHGQKCWLGHSPPHILRAEELANWMKIHKYLFGKLKIYSGEKAYRDALEHIRLRRGVIFFRNFWGPGQQGDHIDLWNRIYATKEFRSLIAALIPSLSSYDRAQEVWFWEMI